MAEKSTSAPQSTKEEYTPSHMIPWLKSVNADLAESFGETEEQQAALAARAEARKVEIEAELATMSEEDRSSKLNELLTTQLKELQQTAEAVRPFLQPVHEPKKPSSKRKAGKGKKNQEQEQAAEKEQDQKQEQDQVAKEDRRKSL